MVQRGFCINTAFELADHTESESNIFSPAALALSRIPSTTVKVVKESNGAEGIHWSRGDIPVLEDENVLFSLPILREYREQDGKRQREPDFEASEFCRLLHVMNDSRMTTTRSMLMEPRTLAQLDSEPVDVWIDSIAPFSMMLRSNLQPFVD